MTNPIVAFLKKFIPAIPNWVTYTNAHIFFAYALIYTFPSWWTVGIAECAFVVKEFYIDKHFETTPQTFTMNLGDFAGYTGGVLLALAVHAMLVGGI